MAAVATIPALLAARAAAEPDHIALIVDLGSDGERALTASLTVAQWHLRANDVAHGLVARGVLPGDRVGLVFGGADWMDYAVAFVAVTAAGAIAVPLSANLPPARIAEALAHCGATLTLTPSNLSSNLSSNLERSGGGQPARRPREEAADTASHGNSHGTSRRHRGESAAAMTALPRVEPDDVAQIIYTSGTTGTPKGVYASHANLTHGVGRLAHSRHVAHAFPIGTNAAQTMLVTALVAQPTVVAAASFDALEFGRLVQRYPAESIFIVPAMAVALLDVTDRLKPVQLIASSAAPLPPSVAVRLAQALPDVTIINNYTSTEAAPAFTSMVFDPTRPTALGRSDDVKVDEAGEVWLRSPFTRGYFGDEEATAATFRGGWVRTGDVGYLDGDGYLHLLDRSSDVVKTAAHKVSTIRVEGALYEHPAVKEAAVVGLPHPTMGSQLVAAVVLKSGSLEDVRASLPGRLAPHEIPTRWAVLESLPRNEAGKVVKGQLAFASAPSEPADGPLAQMWMELLGVPSVGVDDDFFALGGDSLTASRLAQWAGVPVETIFEAPTLSALAARLLQTLSSIGTADTGLPAAASEDEIGLTSVQESMLDWSYATDPPRDVGPVSVAIRIRDEFDAGLLERALTEVIARHDSLRMVFHGRRASILPSCRPSVIETSAIDDLLADREGRFNLETGPLVRAVVFKMAQDDYVLGLAVHHLVFDGASMGVFLRELGIAYSALRVGLPVPSTQNPLDYRGYVAWTRRQWPKNIPYWTEALRGAPSSHHFDARKMPARIRGDSMSFDLISPHLLHEAAAAHGATTFMMIAACWAAVLSHLSGMDDFVLMTPLQGRTLPGSESLIGCLVQSVLLRVDTSGDPTFAELVARVRKASLEAVDHQYHPFHEFVRQHPGAGFLRVEQWAGPAHFPGLESEPFELPRGLGAEWPIPDYDRWPTPELAVVQRQDGTLSAWLLWNPYAFERSTMDEFAATLIRLTQRIPGQMELPLSELLRADALKETT